MSKAKITAAFYDRLAQGMANANLRLSDRATKAVFSTESFDESAPADVADEVGEADEGLKEVMKDAYVDGAGDDANPADVEAEFESLWNGISGQAARVAFRATQKPAEYVANLKGMEGEHTMEGLQVGAGGVVPTLSQSQFTQESFDAGQLNQFQVQNIAVNFAAARQLEGAELMFPTKVMGAGDNGVTVTVHRAVVRKFRQYGVGADAEYLRPLVEAFADADVLNVPATDLVPSKSSENAAYFSDLVSAQETPVNGGVAQFAPVKFNQGTRKVNWKNLCNNPAALGGSVLDTTDQIAPGARLDGVWLALGAAGSEEVVHFPVALEGGTQFLPAQEGQGRDVRLFYRSRGKALKKGLKNIAQVEIAGLDGLNDYTVYLEFTVTATLNLDFGTMDISGSNVVIGEIVDAQDRKLPRDSATFTTVETLIDGLKPRLDSFSLNTKLSNSNWGQNNAIIDVLKITERYLPIYGQPIEVLSPTSGDNAETAEKVKAMSNSIMARNTNNAYTTLFNYEDVLRSNITAMNQGIDVPISGIGRYLVLPYYNKLVINVPNIIANRRSAERAADLEAAIVAALRDEAYGMFLKANYGPALQLGVGVGVKPVVGLLTSDTAHRYIRTVADAKVLGVNMDFVVESTNDIRFITERVVTYIGNDGQEVTEKLDVHHGFMSFVRNRPGHDDGLGFGTFFFYPNVIQRVQVSRFNNTYSVDRAFPINLHSVALPVLVKVEFEGLSKAATTRVGSNTAVVVTP